MHEGKPHGNYTPNFIAMVDKEISNWAKWFTEPIIQKTPSQKAGKPSKKVIKGGHGALPFLEGSNPLDRTGVYQRQQYNK